MKRQTAKDFLISTIFPTVLIPIFTVVVIVVNLINPQNPIPPIVVAIILVVLIVWALLRYSVENEFNLIKKYRSLMNLMKDLDDVMSPVSIRSISLSLKIDSLKKDFDARGQNLNKDFDDLKQILNKINPYHLLLDRNLMYNTRQKFNNLVIENYKLYRDFIEKANTENVSKNSLNYNQIKYAHESFFIALKTSKGEFQEIDKDFDSTCEFFNPLPELKN